MSDAGKPALDARLSLAASFVRPGSAVCDVGTDHAYLPIRLLLDGISPRALVTDIHEAPLCRARENAARYGCADRLFAYLADGLHGVPLEDAGVEDIFVCGMGGEMIARILEEAPYTRRAGVRCILQPMSSAVDLRLSLARAGYRVEDERLAAAGGRIYTCLSVSWDGVLRTLRPAEALLGEANIRRGRASECFAPYLRREYHAALKKAAGRSAGALPTEEDRALLAELAAIAEKEEIKL